MGTEIKYLGVGCVIGVTAAALGIGAILAASAPSAALVQITKTSAPTTSTQPAQPPPAIWAPSPTASFTPIATLVNPVSGTGAGNSMQSQTPDAVQSALNSGALHFSGPLSNAEQIALYRASLGYVQSTIKDSAREAKAINGVGYGDPDNICGPLTIAILRDAGLIGGDIIPHDFWLLDPRAVTDQRILERAFPASQFSYTRVSTPLNKMDWRTSPLEPGDFLFIWHGSGGNFDHMLTVNRVDKELRAYAVTNYGTTSGFMISETMLYDPADPNAGIFRVWTKQRLAILGSTGFGGYELWRRRTP